MPLQSWCWILLALLVSSDRNLATSFAPNAPLVDGRTRYNTAVLWTTAVSSTSSTSSSSIDETNNTTALAKVDDTGRTLYDILGASPEDSREELKRKYIQLARQTHPDAMVGQRNPEDIKQSEAEFSEIAAAWRLLANPKERLRYDRELRAKEFTENLEQLVDSSIRSAVPFIRKTADTTWAAVEESSKSVEQSASEFGKVMKSVRRQVGRVMDSMELVKKSQDLERRAMRELERAKKFRTKIEAVSGKRLQMTLHVPNSSLTSEEALRILDAFNAAEKVSLVDRIKMKHPVVNYIQALEEVELEYQSKVREQEEAAAGIAKLEKAAMEAEMRAHAAYNAEIQAATRLEDARRQVAEARKLTKELEEARVEAEDRAKQARAEMDGLSLALERRQEKVRASLREKEEEILSERNQVLARSKSTQHYSHSDIEELKREEQNLMSETARLEERAQRLRARAQKLRLEAEELKREQSRTRMWHQED